MGLNHPWFQKNKKGFFLQKEAFPKKKVDRVFKPGRSCV